MTTSAVSSSLPFQASYPVQQPTPPDSSTGSVKGHHHGGGHHHKSGATGDQSQATSSVPSPSVASASTPTGVNTIA